MAALLFLAGDVMIGRGIDQILPHPSEPTLFEDVARSALDYVELAERAHGPVNKPVDYTYIWGEALGELERRRPSARIINLETAVTTSRKPEPKGINYRMNPANIAVLGAAKIDCAMLANNHVLDWGVAGLFDSLAALKKSGIQTVGAGGTLSEASQPAIIEVGPICRICVYGFGCAASGIPNYWAAGKRRPGVRLLTDLSKRAAAQIAAEIIGQKRPGDLAVISIHWGANWGYRISSEQQAFAHALIDLGACDILHGHSSHHARAIEVYRGRLILYGCGDFINDYEGIRGYEAYRGDLSMMYLPRLDAASGALEALTLVPFQMRRFRLQRASLTDAEWLQAILNRESGPFKTRFSLLGEGELQGDWA
jgi:poly-gamma-glutamate synthesis protein (capsule biosynthesis protein)